MADFPSSSSYGGSPVAQYRGSSGGGGDSDPAVDAIDKSANNTARVNTAAVGASDTITNSEAAKSAQTNFNKGAAKAVDESTKVPGT